MAPHFDAPWRATSLAEFWSKRWDLAASNALRCVVYEPLLEGVWVWVWVGVWVGTALPHVGRAVQLDEMEHARWVLRREVLCWL